MMKRRISPPWSIVDTDTGIIGNVLVLVPRYLLGAPKLS